MTIYVDHTHLGRHVTGLERITLELFSQDALAPLDVVPVTAEGTRQMVTRQTFGLPRRLLQPDSILLCPGFPPTPLLRPFASRVLPYFHDDFLLTRHDDLNRRARLYMAGPFKFALRTYPRFLTNSIATRQRLMTYCRPDARITLYRPPVRNIFELSAGDRSSRPAIPSPLRLISLGTVEPRKNMLAAARLLTVLRSTGYNDATLDIIGRRGWGDDWSALKKIPGVMLHGYQSSERAAELINRADIFICTSHDEGLGLPLLEAQYAGLPIVAPARDVFREVLAQSGTFIEPGCPASAARNIIELIDGPNWRARAVDLARENLARWNALASSDREQVIGLIAQITRKDGYETSHYSSHLGTTH